MKDWYCLYVHQLSFRKETVRHQEPEGAANSASGGIVGTQLASEVLENFLEEGANVLDDCHSNRSEMKSQCSSYLHLPGC